MMVSEKEREAIRKEAKKILDNFAKALSKVKVREKKLKKELGGFREEGEGKICDPLFKKTMLANAPETDGDYIVAEKKKW